MMHSKETPLTSWREKNSFKKSTWMDLPRDPNGFQTQWSKGSASIAISNEPTFSISLKYRRGLAEPKAMGSSAHRIVFQRIDFNLFKKGGGIPNEEFVSLSKEQRIGTVFIPRSTIWHLKCQPGSNMGLQLDQFRFMRKNTPWIGPQLLNTSQHPGPTST